MRKGERFLKFIIVYKGLMGLIEMALALSFLKFYDGANSRESFNALAVSFNLDPDNRIISSTIERAGSLGSDTVTAIAFFVVAVGAVNCVEAIGLHYRYRWAEWLTVVATGIFIPFELYEVLESASVLKVTILVLNTVVVYYIGKHKELFGKKARKKLRGI
ncbi:hypothetical protein BAC1_01234 [uncultured bacterium]|nr:hypothetical protein BAC1_01234 [uncultured bacterium]